MILSLKQARERLAYWQRVLRLQDWDVDVVIARHHEMVDGNVAQVCPGTTRIATIKLLDPRDFDPKQWPTMFDMEDSIVHELLHLHTKDCRINRGRWDDMTPEGVAEERAISAIAAALVKLDRLKDA